MTNNALFSTTLIILPTYNEIDNIERMVTTLFNLDPGISVLVVDDGSPDGTADGVKKIQAINSRLHLIERSGKLGLGTAYIAGFKWALERDYQYVFEMDCDFSHDPADIPRFLDEIGEADLVIGSRYVGGIRVVNWPMRRLLLSYFASFYTRIITGLGVKDPTGGFKCFRRSALEALDLDAVFSNGYCFQIELSYKLWVSGLRLREIPIIFTDRRLGESKMNRSIVFEAAWGVIKLRLKKIFKCL